MARGSPIVLDYEPAGGMPAGKSLLRQILWLTGPVVIEHVLHLLVGLTDTYMANHLKENRAAGTAAVGTISYFLWFVGLTTSALGTGATAIIARAKGARHKSLANSVCGQAISAAIILGLVVGAGMYLFAWPMIHLASLKGDAPEMAHVYLTMLCWSVPFSTLMFVANACLRGAGDTLTPAISMVVVDGVNMFLTYSLTLGFWGMPELGYRGIAIGTVVAYVVGGVLQFVVLVSGRGGVRLFLHRMRPHWLTLKRVLRIGLPSGVEAILVWVAMFIILKLVNAMDPTNQASAAYNNAVRLEALSYMIGFGVAVAASTLVGQNLGARDPRRAAHAAYLCYAVGGGIMTGCGVLFIFGGGLMARWMSPEPVIVDLTARCLFITGFIQVAFAASIIFSGALRGAGDTYAVMAINLFSIFGIRLAGALVAVHFLHGGLIAVWIVLCLELVCRGLFMYTRFAQGHWRKVQV